MSERSSRSHSATCTGVGMVDKPVSGTGAQQACGFESRSVHQTNKIRTRSSLWETGSDFVFSTRVSFFPMVYCAVQNPSREGRERRKLIDTDISQTQTGVSQII